jgi:uncharacterized delta-60 repeat protein
MSRIATVLVAFFVTAVCALVPEALAAPGDLDPSFGIQGRQLVTVSTDPLIAIHNNTTDILVQPDGKILVSGFANMAISPTSGNDFIILRFNPDGSLDQSFATGGIFKFDYQGGSDQLYGVALQADGKIVAAGQVHLNPFDPNSNTAFAVIRLNTAGTFDSTFGASGLVVTDLMPSLDQATEVVIQPDGRIVATGWSTRSATNNGRYDFALVRYLQNGSLDTSFGTGGSVFTDFNGFGDLAQTSELQPDGKIVLAGWVWVNSISEYDFGLARYNPDGTLDSTFDGDGRVVTPVGNNQNELVRGMDLAPDGKIVVMGDFYNPQNGNVQGNWDVAALRYHPNGTLDATFDGDGKFIYASVAGDRSESGGDVVVQPDGKVLLTGKSHLRTESVPGGTVSHTELFVIRLTPNGVFDTTFGNGGITFTDFGIVTPPPDTRPRTGDRGEAITLQPDGKIVVGGEAVLGNGDYRFVVARFENDITPVVVRTTAFDFDGDGKSDPSVFRPSEGIWYLLNSTVGFSARQFGAAADALVPSDLDGDGKTDIAVFREGMWYWLNSSTGALGTMKFGEAGDVPVTADYTGDGASELAVFRNGSWWTLDLENQRTRVVQFGQAGDKAVPADFDGDARVDPAVIRNGVWYWMRSSDNGSGAVQFGMASDRAVVGEYDGDAKADPAVYRNGTWYILGSTMGFKSIPFGLASDIPAAADYDGDGKTDIAVYRDGAWYISRSQQGLFTVQFGAGRDRPIQSAFVR